MATKKDLNRQAEAILKKAEETGLQNSFFFSTTFRRYQVEIETLERLEEAIKEHGSTITKEYVKGRQNLCINPAINEYNRTATAANNTVVTLMKIIDSFKGEVEKESLSDVMGRLLNE